MASSVYQRPHKLLDPSSFMTRNVAESITKVSLEFDEKILFDPSMRLI